MDSLGVVYFVVYIIKKRNRFRVLLYQIKIDKKLIQQKYIISKTLHLETHLFCLLLLVEFLFLFTDVPGLFDAFLRKITEVRSLQGKNTINNEKNQQAYLLLQFVSNR